MINNNKINWQKLGRVLVTIDAANLESSVKDLGWWVDYLKLKNLFGRNLFDIRHYCVHHGTNNQNNFFSFLKNNGFTLVTKPLKIIKTENIRKDELRKANFDVEISVDVIKMLNKFDTLILFSGDSDFDYLIKSLRIVNKRVIVISSRYHVSKELVLSSTKYIDLKKLKDLIERTNKKARLLQRAVDDG